MGRVISTLLSMQPIGTIAFQFDVAFKKLSLLRGSAGTGASQRTIEYPWVISQVKNIQYGSLVLDLGCSESLFSNVLLSKGFSVVGLDLRDYPFRSKKMTFVKKNVLNTELPTGIFDVIIAVSTIEHVGLHEYSQSVIDENGDIRAINELRRILKPKGVILITTPYIENREPETLLGRTYNRQRLQKLVGEFKILKEDYFYPNRQRERLSWVKMTRKQIDLQIFSEPGLACLILKP